VICNHILRTEENPHSTETPPRATGFELAILFNRFALAALEQDRSTYNDVLVRLSSCDPHDLAVVLAAEYANVVTELSDDRSGATRHVCQRADTLTDCELRVANRFGGVILVRAQVAVITPRGFGLLDSHIIATCPRSNSMNCCAGEECSNLDGSSLSREWELRSVR
jgi:hypothetical protein